MTVYLNNIISEGKALYNDGSYFEGKFKISTIHRQRINKLLGREFTGILHNNSLLRGVLKFPNGDIFKGEFKKMNHIKKVFGIILIKLTRENLNHSKKQTVR